MRRRRTHTKKTPRTRVTKHARINTAAAIPGEPAFRLVHGIRTVLETLARVAIRIAGHRRFRIAGLMLLHRLSTVLIVIGVIAVFSPFLYELFTKNSTTPGTDREVSTASPSASPGAFGPLRIDTTLLTNKRDAQPPTRVIIPSVSIDLPVLESRVVDGYWEVSDTTASHGLGSAYPGQLGNTVLFAHARAGLFLPLRSARLRDIVYVLTNDRWYRYRIETKTEVLPTQVQVIKPTQDETLTLFTCTGFLDTKRLVVVAKPDR